MLVKLHASGHRVLLFSTMTRLLDLLEQYLRWRTVTSPSGQPTTMGYLRIDGSTALEDR
jgi:SNF2 family DNA or RNA helicase